LFTISNIARVVDKFFEIRIGFDELNYVSLKRRLIEKLLAYKVLYFVKPRRYMVDDTCLPRNF